MYERIQSVAVSVLALVCLLIADAGCASAPGAASEAPTGKPLIVFLVRHAEKVDASPDPELSDAGQRRACSLARVLRSADLEYVHATDFVRTKNTAAPTARARGLEVIGYEPGQLPKLVETLRSTGGRHLVVGHSNTTPAMVELLGGDASSPIEESAEYDRLYVVAVASDGAVTTALLRYAIECPSVRDAPAGSGATTE